MESFWVDACNDSFKNPIQGLRDSAYGSCIVTVTQLLPVCVTLQAACDAFVSRLSRIALAPLQVASCSSGGGASMRMDGEAFGVCIAPNP
jgi:hypothetical protein